jgi:hypothetical protein
MRIKSAVTLLAVLSMFPVSAMAQGAININLNDVMVTQRTLEMSQMLNSYSPTATKPRHEKRSKKGKVVSAAILQNKINPSTFDNEKTSTPAANEQNGF